MMLTASPSLTQLPSHKRRFPFGIDCTTEELSFWCHLSDVMTQTPASDSEPIVQLNLNEILTRTQLRQMLNGVVRLDLLDTQKKPDVSISFLDLFPNAQQLSLGPPSYQGGIYHWNLLPTRIADRVQSIQIRELSGNWNGLQQFIHCRILELWRCRIDDFHFLKDCSPLTELRLAGCTIDSFEGIALASVNHLNLNEPHGPCRHWDDCVNIRGLSKLDIWMTGKMASFPSCRHSSVKHVALTRCNQLRDLHGLAEAPQLESLYLSESPASQPRYLTPLAKHPNLKKVELFTMSLAKFRKCKAILGHLIPETETEWLRMRDAIR